MHIWRLTCLCLTFHWIECLHYAIVLNADIFSPLPTKIYLAVYIANFHFSFPHFLFVHLFLIDLYYFSCQRFMNVSQTTNENTVQCLNLHKEIYLSLWALKYEIFIDLPENIAQIVAMTTENSTVIAPVSLNTITGTNTIIPMANRLHVPGGIMSKSLFCSKWKRKRNWAFLFHKLFISGGNISCKISQHKKKI